MQMAMEARPGIVETRALEGIRHGLCPFTGRRYDVEVAAVPAAAWDDDPRSRMAGWHVAASDGLTVLATHEIFYPMA